MKIGDGQIDGAEWQLVEQSLHAWSEQQPDVYLADLGLRITYLPSEAGQETYQDFALSVQRSVTRMTAVVKAESLTKRFGEVSAVTDLSFALEAGTITGFLGPERRWQDDDAADDPGSGGADEWTSTGVRSSLRGVAACGIADRCRARGDRFPSRPFGPRSPADARAGRRCS